jgi:hypothetical protein
MSNEVEKVETQAVGFFKSVEIWISTAWGKVEAVFQFLDSPGQAKFSHKRLIAVACTVVAIRQFIKGDPFGGCVLLGAAVVLAVVSALTKT